MKSNPYQDMHNAFADYLRVRKAGKRDRVKLLALIADTRAYYQAQKTIKEKQHVS